MARTAPAADAAASAAVAIAAAVLSVLPSLRGAPATKQSSPSAVFWIASRGLSSGAHPRDPLAPTRCLAPTNVNTGVFMFALLG
jgi:hypothetical protein